MEQNLSFHLNSPEWVLIICFISVSVSAMSILSIRLIASGDRLTISQADPEFLALIQPTELNNLHTTRRVNLQLKEYTHILEELVRQLSPAESWKIQKFIQVYYYKLKELSCSIERVLGMEYWDLYMGNAYHRNYYEAYLTLYETMHHVLRLKDYLISLNLDPSIFLL